MRAEAEKLEDKYGTGTVHAVRYVFTGNKLEAEIVFDHDRVKRCSASSGAGGADKALRRGDDSDKEPKPAEGSGTASGDQLQASKPIQPQRRDDHRGDSKSKGGATAPAPSPAAAPPTGTDQVSKERVTEAARTLKTYITSVVRALGGDERSGGAYLLPPPPQPPLSLRISGHRVKFRFPVGSPAAHKSPSELQHIFGQEVAHYLSKGGDPTALDESVRAFLTPPGVAPAGDMDTDTVAEEPKGASSASASEGETSEASSQGLFARAKARVMSPYAGA